MKLSIIIPAHNEQDSIEQTVRDIIDELNKEKIDNEIIIVDDNSTDSTAQIVTSLAAKFSNIKVVCRIPPKGFGRAIREGLTYTSGDVVATVMGDLSDDPKDIVRCFRKIQEGYDCVFGSRFMNGSIVRDYPLVKLLINRLANNFIRALFLIKPNDITNAFKLYRAKVIKAVQPLQALYFNITVEIPLKAIVRGFSYTQIPIN
jgi:dolichol-phosphate mannosyltransferase